jgi:hypothetical protein
LSPKDDLVFKLVRGDAVRQEWLGPEQAAMFAHIRAIALNFVVIDGRRREEAGSRTAAWNRSCGVWRHDRGEPRGATGRLAINSRFLTVTCVDRWV